MKKLLFFLPLLFLNILHAQKNVTKESLLNNKDISWVAEYDVTIPFDLHTNNLNDSAYNKYHSPYERAAWITSYNNMDFLTQMGTIGFGSTTLKEMEIFNNIAVYFARAARSPKTLAYFDAELQKKMSADDKKKLGLNTETITLIDPDTYSEKDTTVVTDLFYNSVRSVVKLKLLVYFDNKSASFNAVCLSIAPIVDYYDLTGIFISSGEAVWLPVDNFDKTLDYSGSNINYAKNTLISVDLSKAKTLKSLEKPNDAGIKILSAVRKSPSKHEIYFGQIGLENTSEITDESKKNFGERIDSITIVDPVTLEEKLEVVKSSIKAEHIRGIRFEMNWYWDGKEQKLKATTLAFAPIVDYFDNEGILRACSPAFYKKVCKGKVIRPNDITNQ